MTPENILLILVVLSLTIPCFVEFKQSIKKWEERDNDHIQR